MRLKIFFLAFFLTALAAVAQPVVQLKQQRLSKWGVGTANFSGIAPIHGDRYVMVSDKEPEDGFFEFRIVQNPILIRNSTVADLPCAIVREWPIIHRSIQFLLAEKAISRFWNMEWMVCQQGAV